MDEAYGVIGMLDRIREPSVGVAPFVWNDVLAEVPESLVPFFSDFSMSRRWNCWLFIVIYARG